ncbi:hypothetical protein [Herbidospora galbida]|uniref:hypothetical protein n=1 Tax=Herbidospora galbida TaxID=2575442 RepID=UPI001485BED3|nr:hypothetical protein [Herbidospora galbida]
MTIDVDAVLDALARREAVRSADPAILVLKALIADVDSIQEVQRLSSVSMTPST